MKINTELITELSTFYGENDNLVVINEKDETLMIIYNWCVISIKSDGYIEVDLYQTTLNFVLIDFLNEFRKNADKIYSS